MCSVGAATAFTGPGFLLPTRNHDLFRWCLDNGLGLVKQQTLMTIGLYNEPTGAYCHRSYTERESGATRGANDALDNQAPRRLHN